MFKVGSFEGDLQHIYSLSFVRGSKGARDDMSLSCYITLVVLCFGLLNFSSSISNSVIQDENDHF